jgi:phage shock protein E
MKRCTLALLSISACWMLATHLPLFSSGSAAEPAAAKDNPAIDMTGYLRIAQEAAKHRQNRRITEDDFLRMSQEKGTIVLDARSKEKFDQLHIKGAINLSFPDIAIETLKKTLPDKDARILIYCNNNFKGARFVKANAPFESKIATASLNISTYIALYNYGYHNIYELGPQLDPEQSKLPFEPAIDKK